jgi:hypothetical protein
VVLPGTYVLGLHWILCVISFDDIMYRNAHERVVLRRGPIVQVLRPACRSYGGRTQESEEARLHSGGNVTKERSKRGLALQAGVEAALDHLSGV